MTNLTPNTTDAESIEFVLDVCNVPIEGIAMIGQQPYHFVAEFDDERDEYSEVYEVTPISESTLRLAKDASERLYQIRSKRSNEVTRAEWEAQLKALHDAIDTDRRQQVVRKLTPRFVLMSNSGIFEKRFRVIWGAKQDS